MSDLLHMLLGGLLGGLLAPLGLLLPTSKEELASWSRTITGWFKPAEPPAVPAVWVIELPPAPIYDPILPMHLQTHSIGWPTYRELSP